MVAGRHDHPVQRSDPVVFLWFGHNLLIRLKIDLASFKIGGELILLQFGFSMLKGTAVELSNEPVDESTDLKRKVLSRYQQIFIPMGVYDFDRYLRSIHGRGIDRCFSGVGWVMTTDQLFRRLAGGLV